MADITEPQVTKYANEVVRPLAESLRALKARVDAALVTWDGTISTETPDDASVLADEREAEGVSRLTGADINSFVAKLTGFQNLMELAGVEDTINKPCVRALEIR